MKQFPVIFAAISALLCLLFIAVNGNNVDDQTKEMVAYIILCCLSLIVLGISSKSNFMLNMVWCWVFGILGGVIVGLIVKAFGW